MHLRSLLCLAASVIFLLPVFAQQNGPAERFLDNQQLNLLMFHKKNKGSPFFQGYGTQTLQIWQRDGKYGIFDTKDSTWFAHPEYDAVTGMGNYTKGNVTGNFFFGPPVPEYRYTEPEYIIIAANGSEGLLRVFTGDTVVAPQYEALQPTAAQNVFISRNGARYGFISLSDTPVIIAPQYDFAYYAPGYSPYADTNLSRDCVIAHKGKEKFAYTPGGLLYNNKGFHAVKGKEYQGPEPFDDLGYSFFIPDDRLIYHINGKYGLDDHNRKELIPARYNSIEALQNGYFIVSNDKGRGLVNHDGKIVIEPQFERLEYLTEIEGNTLYLTGNQNTQAIYDNTGKMLYDPLIDEVKSVFTTTYNGQSALWIYIWGIVKTPGITYSHNGQEIQSYTHTLLKYDSGKLNEVLRNYYDINFYPGKNPTLASVKNGDRAILYNLKTGAHTGNKYTSIISSTKGQFFASTTPPLPNLGYAHTIVLDSAFTETPLPVSILSRKNNGFIITDGKGMQLADSLYKPISKVYPYLKAFNELSSLSDDFKRQPAIARAYNSLYYYKTDITDKKPGVLYNGKIQVPAGKYTLIRFTTHQPVTGYTPQIQKEVDKYANKILVAYTGEPENKVDFYKEDKLLLSLPSLPGEAFSYGYFTPDNQYLFFGKDSISAINLTSKKADFKIPSGHNFTWLADGTFQLDSLPNYYLSAVYRYNTKGQLLGKTIRNQLRKPYITIKNGKYGMADSWGIPTLPFKYDTLYPNPIYHLQSKSSVYIGNINKKFGAAPVLPFEFDSITLLKKKVLNSWDKNYYLLRKGKKYGLASETLEQLIPAEHDTVWFTRDNIVAQKGREYTIHNIYGRVLKTITCDSLTSVNGTLFNYYNNGRQGIIDKLGNVIIAPLFKTVWANGFNILALTAFDADGKVYWVNGNGQKLRPEPVGAVLGYFNPNIATAPAYYQVIEPNGYYSLYSADYKLLLPPFYKDAYWLNGTARVQNDDGLWGLVSPDNKILIPFKYIYINPLETGELEAADKKKYYRFSPYGMLLSEAE